MAALPATMTAIGIKAAGGPDMLVSEQRPAPVPGAGEILVKVAAAGVNRPDVMQRMGLYPPPPGAPDIPGLEDCRRGRGDSGADVKRWKLGDRSDGSGCRWRLRRILHCAREPALPMSGFCR
jgi:NADPH:quinone reductase-like Zn-dependent oxidoreductase